MGWIGQPVPGLNFILAGLERNGKPTLREPSFAMLDVQDIQTKPALPSHMNLPVTNANVMAHPRSRPPGLSMFNNSSDEVGSKPYNLQEK